MHRDLGRYTSEIIKHIKDDTNILGIIQVIKPLGLRLKIRLKLEVEVRNGLKA